MYLRVLADTHLVVSHMVAVEYAFAPRSPDGAPGGSVGGTSRGSHERARRGPGGPPFSCFEELILPSLERLQGMVGYTRQHGEHVEYESDDWMLAMYLEVGRAATSFAHR